MPSAPASRFEILPLPGGGRRIVLSGAWTLRALMRSPEGFQRRLREAATGGGLAWNCLDVAAMDSAGALILWRVWGHAMPAQLDMRPEHRQILARIAAAERAPADLPVRRTPLDLVVALGILALRLRGHVLDMVALVGRLALDTAHVFARPLDIPWKEISANLYKSGVRAMPVTALVGFLVGVVLAYLSSLQLRQFGADVLIVNILGIGIIREIGPVLVAVLVAGRSGSAMTAQLGVMRVTEEIDALAAMGVPRNLRLIFPKVAALAVVTPMLVLWTSAMALFGGMVSAMVQLDVSPLFFIQSMAWVVPLPNLWIAFGKGILFGILVALVACHFGLRVRPNTESLSANTTSSVVTAITVVILADAVFAIATRHIGLIG